ncbi:hypothetical protein CAXC1_220053 [Candidatus Xenohaliotis californiensis]|uniref:Uncharacterized protein n=1 Tax=Candidatus Xenohaliotis californiensis TaxID=84677 RepID=A0ABP0EVU5_9RICK|nr:hypothetical protein CAXC1_220053 [Candidatus Xenohaliotis californiensis]
MDNIFLHDNFSLYDTLMAELMVFLKNFVKHDVLTGLISVRVDLNYQ